MSMNRGLPIEVFDGFRAALVANRAQFYREVPSGPFYGFNRPGATVLPGVIDNWWQKKAGPRSGPCR
jgi:non-heme chloroperoxidase